MSDSQMPSGRDPRDVLDQFQASDQPAQIRTDPAAILGRFRYLPAADQHLLTLALSGRHSFRQIAALVGSNPGSVCRRVALLTRRLCNPIVVSLLERPMGLSEAYQQIGLQRFLFKRGVRSISREIDLSENEVRVIIHYLQRWARMVRDLSTRPPPPTKASRIAQPA